MADVLVADTYWLRLRGMLGRRPLPEALLLRPGGGVHGVGMTASLDVAFLRPASGARRCGRVTDAHVVARVSRLRPFGLSLAPRGTCCVLETPVGRLAGHGCVVGSTVTVRT